MDGNEKGLFRFRVVCLFIRLQRIERADKKKKEKKKKENRNEKGTAL